VLLQNLKRDKLVQIGHLPRRIKDLKDPPNNVMISFTLKDSYKEWYMDKYDLEFNKKMYELL